VLAVIGDISSKDTRADPRWRGARVLVPVERPFEQDQGRGLPIRRVQHPARLAVPYGAGIATGTVKWFTMTGS
jgi:hypothetical protein